MIRSLFMLKKISSCAVGIILYFIGGGWMSVRLPIGIEWFREIREKGSYYVDKTEAIKELFDED